MIGMPQYCPRCGSNAIRPSRSGLIRYAARMIGLRPIRCLTCHSRSWRFMAAPPSKRPPAVTPVT